MELVEGKSLHTLSADGGLPAESVLRYGVQVASALVRAHDPGVVHRDLKAANIVVTAEGLVKVLDFGLAVQVGGGTFEASTRSFGTMQDTSGVCGTLPYIAPEILRGQPADYRSDLWGFGVVLYEAASGRLPFEGSTAFEISSAILREIPKPLGPPVPPGLWESFSVAWRRNRCSAINGQARCWQLWRRFSLRALSLLSPLPSAMPPEPRSCTTATSASEREIFLLLVGTIKGAFVLRSNARRTRWELGGPYFHGNAVYAMAYDDRAGRHRIWASSSSFWGTMLRSSDDFGKSWTNPQEAANRFPLDTGFSLKNIWQIALGRSQEPDVLYCGVEPAALFESRDAGETWSFVHGLFEHPHRPRWMPGNGGLALHTIVLDPTNQRRMYVAISAGGVYRTDDAGATWTAQNRGVRVVFAPDKFPEFGQCVHKIALHPSRPERLFLQNHWGVYRSENYAENWTDIADGVPSDFGFAMVMHPRNPDCVYIVPVESDDFRCTCDGRLRVYRTRNGGASWEPLMRGLPQKQAYETVLRDAMTVDTLDPVGIYFGTRSGQLFASRDEGKSWEKILEGLPSVLCLRTAVVDYVTASSSHVSTRIPTARSSGAKSRTTHSSRRRKR